MKFSYFLAPTLGALLALYLIRNYDLNEDEAYRIKATLQERRAARESASITTA